MAERGSGSTKTSGPRPSFANDPASSSAGESPRAGALRSEDDVAGRNQHAHHLQSLPLSLSNRDHCYEPAPLLVSVPASAWSRHARRVCEPSKIQSGWVLMISRRPGTAVLASAVRTSSVCSAVPFEQFHGGHGSGPRLPAGSCQDLQRQVRIASIDPEHVEGRVPGIG